MPTDIVKIGRALISVSDKARLVDLGKALTARDVEILSTGGTAAALAEAGVPVMDVAQVTAFPEMMDGRVKTLHPRIHGGLLAIRADPSHQAAMLVNGIAPIDLLIVNLYPFEATLRRTASFEDRIENIDVGGPAMVRGAAKNHEDVAVIVDVADYDELLAELERHDGGTGLAFRRRLAQKAYARTAAYDAAISNWLAGEVGETTPKWRAFGGVLHERFGALRYGENPHQSAALYLAAETRPGVATARQVQGKALSYNNINDTDAAYELVAEFDPAKTAAVAIIKHANPCGVAVGETLLEAYEKALACDPVSAFGGIVALNRRLDAEAAKKIVEIFTEVIIAPEADDEAIAIIATKKNLRLMIAGALPDPQAGSVTVRSVAGGLLVQDRDGGALDPSALKVVTKRAPTPAEFADLAMAWTVAKHVKSNAIVYVRDGSTAGVGAGQMSRVDSARVAALKAADAAKAAGWPEPRTKGSVVASDAFFPFADGLVSAIEAGATAVIQPGGSVRDAEVIAAADEAGVAMVFTGIRHFRH
ncbi:IMP cyclohydrolase /phosphoribosylaminoimidazolecarboxamide formyltransferase [Roseiarcus fermentans]|uniref:Bifunctional purine biosynthesis protein PurH n=1 Tax=Roseiarcus fermentans TaxID=1473586 RepID=A0A366FP88_9HYPH|nr:bifunctional phosphoribosylaminoimidazolecarboxamide formyltransferase/IMP cyclohydrolase [Roseiarcus fermentans]RBP16462.1 IMP cyclohydrolase /phosphoribosylaminoimidazolecarboxamide formyltransferase [Roseiarcus fermentans]